MSLNSGKSRSSRESTSSLNINKEKCDVSSLKTLTHPIFQELLELEVLLSDWVASRPSPEAPQVRARQPCQVCQTLPGFRPQVSQQPLHCATTAGKSLSQRLNQSVAHIMEVPHTCEDKTQSNFATWFYLLEQVFFLLAVAEYETEVFTLTSLPAFPDGPAGPRGPIGPCCNMNKVFRSSKLTSLMQMHYKVVCQVRNCLLTCFQQHFLLMANLRAAGSILKYILGQTVLLTAGPGSPASPGPPWNPCGP